MASLALAGVAAFATAACGPVAAPSSGPVAVTPGLATAQASLSAQVAGTVAILRRALEGTGIGLQSTLQPYRPAEPPELARVPRAVLRADVADPEQGYVVIYDFASPDQAAAAAPTLAAFLESGFGQTNYPLDAEFGLTQLGGTLVFTWFSPERAADRERSRAAFDAIRSVGQPIPVEK